MVYLEGDRREDSSEAGRKRLMGGVVRPFCPCGHPELRPREGGERGSDLSHPRSYQGARARLCPTCQPPSGHCLRAPPAGSVLGPSLFLRENPPPEREGFPMSSCLTQRRMPRRAGGHDGVCHGEPTQSTSPPRAALLFRPGVRETRSGNP